MRSSSRTIATDGYSPDVLAAVLVGGVHHGAVEGVVGFERPYAETPVHPIFCTSDKDVSRELDTVCATFLNDKADWEAHRDALLRLRQLVVGGAAEFPCFSTKVFTAVHRLAKLVKDLRSELVKLSCLVVAELSAALQQAFEPFTEHIVPSLLEAPKVSIEIIRVSADQCMQTIIWNAPSGFTKLIPRIVSTYSSPSKAVRVSVLKYLCQLCRQWPKASLTKHWDSLEHCMTQGLSDADPDARANARQMFWCLNAHTPDKLSMKLSKLDPSTEQLVRNDQAAVIRAASASAAWHITTLQDILGVGSAAATALLGDDDEDDDDGGIVGALPDSTPASHAPSLASSRRSMGMSMRVPASVVATAVTAGTASASNPKATAAVTTGVLAAPPRRPVTRTSIGVPTSFEALMEEDVPDEEVYGAPSANTRAATSKKPPMPAASAGLRTGAVRLPAASQLASVETSHTAIAPPSLLTSGPARRVVAPAEKPSQAASRVSSVGLASSLMYAAEMAPTTSDHSTGDAKAADEFNVKITLTQCNDVDWDTRRKGLLSLTELATDPRRHTEIHGAMDAIAKCLSDRLEDRNNKVVQAALDVIVELAQHHGSPFKPSLDAVLFPRLMAHVHSLTPATATKAGQVVGVLLECCNLSDLAAWCMKTLINTAEVGVRSGSLDVLGRVCSKCSAADGMSTLSNVFTYLNSASRLKQVLTALAKCATVKKHHTHVRLVCKSLSVWDSDAIGSALSTCTSDTQSALGPLMGDHPVTVAAPPPAPPAKAKSALTSTKAAVAPPPAPDAVSLASPPIPDGPDPVELAVQPPSPIVPADRGTGAPRASNDAPTLAVLPIRPPSELRDALVQLCRPSASVSEQAACLRVVAHALQEQRPLISPIALHDGDGDESETIVTPLLMKLSECLQTGNAPLRVLTCTVLRRAVRRFSHVIAVSHLSELLSACLNALEACTREEFHVVEWSMAEVLKGVAPDVAVESVVGMFEEIQLEPVVSPAQLQFAIRALSFLVQASRDAHDANAMLVSHLDTVFMPMLIKAFRHPSPDVRKSVVFALVDLVGTFGVRFQARLEEHLDLAQRKLVGIYLQKALDPHAQAHGAPSPPTPTHLAVGTDAGPSAGKGSLKKLGVTDTKQSRLASDTTL